MQKIPENWQKTPGTNWQLVAKKQDTRLIYISRLLSYIPEMNNWNLKLKHNTFTTPPKMINLSKNPTIKLDERKIYLLYLNYSPPLGKMNTVMEGGKNYLVEHLLYARYIKHSLDYYFSQL